jgi:hypothetical protein
MNINNGTGHFSGDDTFIRVENKEKKQLFEEPPQELTKKQIFHYNLQAIGPMKFLEEMIIQEKEEIGRIRKNIIDIGGRKGYSKLLIDMYDEGNASDSDEPDDPVEEGNVRVGDGYIYDNNIKNKYESLSMDEKMELLEQFPNFGKEINEHMEGYGYFCPECPGNIPRSYVRKEGIYKLMEMRGPQLCDNPECSLIAHSAIDEGLFQDEDEYDMTYRINSYYYEILPVYTRNKNHELCALCVTK